MAVTHRSTADVCAELFSLVQRTPACRQQRRRERQRRGIVATRTVEFSKEVIEEMLRRGYLTEADLADKHVLAGKVGAALADLLNVTRNTV